MGEREDLQAEFSALGIPKPVADSLTAMTLKLRDYLAAREERRAWDQYVVAGYGVASVDVLLEARRKRFGGST